MSRRGTTVAAATAGVGLLVVVVVGRHDVRGLLAGAVMAVYLVATILLLRRHGDRG